jgi:hypothetical protein
VTNIRLGESYVERAVARLPFLRQMQAAGLHADVVQESQEVVELALKGVLRIIGVDPPKEHDVSKQLAAQRDRCRGRRRTRPLSSNGFTSMLGTPGSSTRCSSSDRSSATIAVFPSARLRSSMRPLIGSRPHRERGRLRRQGTIRRYGGLQEGAPLDAERARATLRHGRRDAGRSEVYTLQAGGAGTPAQ